MMVGVVILALALAAITWTVREVNQALDGFYRPGGKLEQIHKGMGDGAGARELKRAGTDFHFRFPTPLSARSEPVRPSMYHLERDGEMLRLFDPATGQRLLTRLEAREAAEQRALASELAHQQLAEENERLRREIEGLRPGR
jgi:hypothetical protein